MVQAVKVQAPKPIEIDTMLAFMKDRGLKAGCPHCSVVGWRMMESDAARGTFMGTLSSEGMDGGGILPIAPLICKNCGYVWPIARQTIEEWMEQRGADAAE